MNGAEITQLFDYLFMVMLLFIGLAIIRLQNLFAVVMLTGVYSLIAAAWFVSLSAADVAITEAAVGAGISTVLLLAAMLLTSGKAKPTTAFRHWAALVVMTAAGAAVFYALGDLPIYGAADSPANTGVGMAYIDRTPGEINIPNVVTAVLASYRGFDTMGEVFVVFAAGVGVALLLNLSGRGKREEDN